MAGLDKPRIVVVCGPTASGKSDFALEISRQYGGEMVSADSMQIYKGLEIGTATLAPAEAGGIPQHLVGFVPPQQPFSVADYCAAADAAIRDITARGRLPVVCGGTGLYISSLLNGLDFTPTPGDEALRKTLEAEWSANGGEAMLQKLAGHDAAHAAKLHPRDKKRILRSLELFATTGKTAAQREAASRPASAPYAAACFVLVYADRAALYQRINHRVDAMLAAGLLAEARTVYENRESYKTAAQAIGYKELFPYFAGEQPLEPCVEELKTATRRYAKRQLTWFRRMQGSQALCVDEPGWRENAKKALEIFLQ